MRLLTAALLLAVVSVLAPAGSAATPQEHPILSDEVPGTCPVTRPSDHPFIPPAPYPSADASWIGNEKLWTNITAEGIWRGLPHYTPGDSRFRQKLFWWHEGYDWHNENPPELTVRGMRLDAPAPPIDMDEHANNAGISGAIAMVVGIFIPTVGCWQITGGYHGEELSYVVWVSDSREAVDSNECSPNELLALIKPDDPAYADAMQLSQSLQAHGVVVKCILQSTMVRTFEDQKGAAFFKTDYGEFSALFLLKPLTFDWLQIVSDRDNDRFLYSFRGIPRPASPHPINSNHQVFFEKHGNLLLISSKGSTCRKDSQSCELVAPTYNSFSPTCRGLA